MRENEEKNHICRLKSNEKKYAPGVCKLSRLFTSSELEIRSAIKIETSNCTQTDCNQIQNIFQNTMLCV